VSLESVPTVRVDTLQTVRRFPCLRVLCFSLFVVVCVFFFAGFLTSLLESMPRYHLALASFFLQAS